MPVVGFHLLQLVGNAQRLVDAMSLRECLPDAPDGKEVADRRQHQERLGREAVNEVRKVHAVLQPAREDLLGVLRPERVQKHPPRIDVAGGRGHLDAIVQGRKVRRVRAAAGVARGADAGRIHFGARQQVVQSANAVPDGVAGEGVSHQHALRAEFGMFHGGGEELGIVPVRIEELLALFLAERIPGEGHVSPAGQRAENLLPGGMGFAAHFMPQRKQDGGVRRRAFLRQDRDLP